MDEKDYNAYFEQPEFKNLLRQYEEMVRTGRQTYFDSEELTDIAEYYATRNREEEAGKVIEYALSIHPGSTDPLIFKARTLMLKGDYEGAWQMAECIPDQSDREVTFLYAELLLINEQLPAEARFARAEKLLKKGVLDREETHNDYLLSVQDITELYADYEFYSEARELAEATLERVVKEEWKPSSQTTARLILAECYGYEMRYYDAVKLVNEVLDADAYNTEAWYKLGNLYSESERFQDALDAFDYALAIDEEMMRALFAKANCLAMLSHPAEALRLYETCERKGFAPPVLYYARGMVAFSLDLFEETIEYIQKSFQGCHESWFNIVDAYVNLAISYVKTDRTREAEEIYHKAEQREEFDELTLSRLWMFIQNGCILPDEWEENNREEEN